MRNQVTNWYKAQNITPDETGVNYWVDQLSQEGADFNTVLGPDSYTHQRAHETEN